VLFRSGKSFKCIICGKEFRKQFVKNEKGNWVLERGRTKYCSDECFKKHSDKRKLAKWEAEKAPILQKKLELYEDFLEEFNNEFFESYRNKIEDILDQQLKILEVKFIACLNQIIDRTKFSKRINFNLIDIKKSNMEDIEKELEENGFIKKDKKETDKIKRRAALIKKAYGISMKQYNKLTSKCAICGFNKLVDLHHIVPISKGGSNDSENFVGLCPNHHQMIHKRGYSFEDLKNEIKK